MKRMLVFSLGLVVLLSSPLQAQDKKLQITVEKNIVYGKDVQGPGTGICNASMRPRQVVLPNRT